MCGVGYMVVGDCNDVFVGVVLDFFVWYVGV